MADFDLYTKDGLADDHLCEMMAGRVAQLQHGTRKK